VHVIRAETLNFLKIRIANTETIIEFIYVTIYLQL
jgi:hypothetical protein